MLLLLGNVTIRTKVLIAFLLVLVVAVGLGLFALVGLGAVNDAAIAVRDDSLPSTILTARLESAGKQYRIAEARHILSSSAARKAAIEQELRAVQQEIRKLRADYEPLIAASAERDLVSKFDRQWTEYVDLHTTALLPLSRQNEDEKAGELFDGKSRELFAAAMTTLGELIEFEIGDANKTASDGQTMFASARLWIIAAMALAALLCVAFGWTIVVSVCRPIARMTEVMRRLAGRDMTVEILGLHQDEIGDMAKAVDVFRQSMIRAEELAAELRASEKRLHKEKQHLARAQHLAFMASYQLDLRTGQFEWSDEARRIFGLDRETLPATLDELEALMPQDDLQRVRDTVARARECGDAIPTTEYLIRRPDGSLRIIYCEVEKILSPAGRPTDLFGVIRDVTELRDAERQRNEFERQMQEAQKMEALGTLAGGVAHDLNNALVPIIGLSGLMRHDASDGSPEQQMLAAIEEGGNRARNLVRQILTFARRDEPKRELLDMAVLAGSVLKLLRSGIPATITIEERFGCVPPVLADEGQIYQVLMNLVTNAAHAIGDRMGTITIEIAEVSSAPLDGAAAAVRVSVTDTGCGMDGSTRQRIFEPFFTTKLRNEGTGLGLSVVHGIVTSHKGAITVESKPGQGTKFDVYFPIAEEIAAMTEANAA